MGSVLAIVSKAVFKKAQKAAGLELKVGDVFATDTYLSKNKGLKPLADGGDLYLVTVRPDDVAWLVGVLRSPKFQTDKWVAKTNVVPIADISALIPQLVLANGKGIKAKPGKLGMSLQTPRALADADVKLLETMTGAKKKKAAPASTSKRVASPDDWLPIGAPRDSALMKRIDELLEPGLEALPEVVKLLQEVHTSVEFDAPFAKVVSIIEPRLATIRREPARTRMAVISIARMAGLRRGPRWIRPLIKDPARFVRSRAQSALGALQPSDASIPAPDGEAGWRAWSSGNVHAHGKEGLARREAGSSLRTKWKVPEIATVGDLRAHLGIASTQQLRWLLTATDAQRGVHTAPYVRFEIPKRDGGAREICAPRGTLRRVQRKIYDTILKDVKVHAAAHGFVPGRSVLTNAELHRGKKIVVKLDLVDFFPTIHYWRVVGLFASLGYEVVRGRFGHEDEHRSVAATLARLCSYTPTPHSIGEGWAPQGAPTSPAISNLVCRRLDARLEGLAQRVKGTYTRYADDLTFSFDEVPEGGLGRFRWWVDEIVHQEGFQLNHRKFRILRGTQRQQVTGLVVNDGVGIPRRERRRFRAILHNCEKHGVASQRKGNDHFEDWLRGYGAWIRMVHPDEGEAIQKRIDALLGGAS